jgi:hypothetical protein
LVELEKEARNDKKKNENKQGKKPQRGDGLVE